MQLKSKINNIEFNIFWMVIFLLPLFKFLIEYNFFNLRFIDDTQGAYSYFQYIFNYFDKYYNFPLWIDYLDGGLPSSFIFQHELSLISTVFIILGNLFNLNPYWAFIGLILFYNSLFLFGLYLNFKNFNLNIKVFLLVSIVHLLSFDIFFHFHSLVLLSFVPFTLYYIKKFFDNYKLIKLKQLAILNLLLFFIHIHYYNVVILIYFPLLVFLIYWIVNFIFLKSNINFNIVIKDAIKLKNIIWLFLFILFVIFLYIIVDFQLNEYSHSSHNRYDDFKTNYHSFINFAGLPISKIINWFFLETFLLVSLNPGPVGISLLILSFFIIKKTDEFNLWLISLFIILISFYLSNSHNFYFLNNFFGKFLYALPMVDFVKGLFLVIFFAKFYFLLIFGLSLNKILSKKIYTKTILLSLIILNVIYTEILFSINFKEIDTYIWFPYIIGINIFLIGLLFLKKKNYFNLIIIIFFSSLPFYFISFTTPEYYDGKNYKKLDQINKDKNIYNNIYCFKKDDIKNFYNYYTNETTIPLSKHQQFFLNTKYKPCNVIKSLRLRGSKKNHNLFKNNALASFIDSDRNFNYKIELDGEQFYVSNYFLDEYQNKKFRIIKPSHYIFDILDNEKETKISFSKNWRIKGNQDDFYLKNSNGYLKIVKKNKINEVELFYHNTMLKIIIFLFTFIGFVSFIYFLYEIIRNVIQINSNVR